MLLHFYSNPTISWYFRLQDYVIFVFLSIFLLLSCSPEKKLAREFLKNHDQVAVAVLSTDYLFKTNLIAPEIKNFRTLNEKQQDSLLLATSIFLKEIDDTLFLRTYFKAFLTTLENFNIKVYAADQIAEFMRHSGDNYKVVLAQVEIEEDNFVFRADEIFDDVYYYQDFTLNRIRLHCWFETIRLNSYEKEQPVLYASEELTDGFEGKFIPNWLTGEVKLHYNYYPLTLNDVYRLAAIAGERHAGYLFDYLMNEFIQQNSTGKKQKLKYLSYQRESGKFSIDGDRRFILMQQ